MSGNPQIVILGGPNGAGKTTAAPFILRDALQVTEFVNVDTIARGLAGFDPAGVTIQAARILLDRLDALAAARADFAFETTLASRSFVPWIRKRQRESYQVHLAFVALPSADLAVERVRERVNRGGHSVPEGTIRRRFHRGLSNLFDLYLPLMTTWRLYDNSRARGLQVVAEGARSVETHVHVPLEWQNLKELAHGR